MPMSAPQEKQFGPPQTVKMAMKLEPYYVEYFDGEGRPNTRIAFKDESGKGVFILQESIGGVLVATAANRWFAQGLDKAAKSDLPAKTTEIEAESI